MPQRGGNRGAYLREGRHPVWFLV